MTDLVIKQQQCVKLGVAERIKISFAKLTLWRRRAKTRYQLSQLSKAQLRDIGIEVSAAQREAKKWFWQ